MTGVEIDGGIIAADAVVVALGPWSLLAAAMDGSARRLRAAKSEPRLRHRHGCPGGCALPRISGRERAALTVEVFPRADGSTHVMAFSDEAPLPLDPAAVTPEPDEIDRLQAICERLSPLFAPEKIIARQACFRPVTQDGLPLIGKVGEGAYVATGHSVWGILNAPATGEALAELIVDGVARSTGSDAVRPGPAPAARTRRCCAPTNQCSALFLSE